jgi:hypothetical protein
MINLVFNHRYLRTGTRRVQKRKTATIKSTYNPEYHTKLKYNACNVMGNILSFSLICFLTDIFQVVVYKSLFGNVHVNLKKINVLVKHLFN